MKNTFRSMALFASLVFLFSLSLAAQQKAEDTAQDPVCGMELKKVEAKATYEYNGTNYYFCCQGCKGKFAKDPEMYLAKEVKEMFACPHHPDVKSDKPGKSPHCGMEMMPMKEKMAVKEGHPATAAPCCSMSGLLYGKDVELKVENTKDGVLLTISSKNADAVKNIQEMAAKVKAGCNQKDCPEDCDKI